MAELCDGLDNDCDGSIPAEEADEDGDRWRICEDDCDDASDLANPGLLEACNDDIDNDCDGQTDEECLPFADGDTGDVTEDDPSKGCGCRVGGAPTGALWGAMMVTLLVRRRAPPASRVGSSR